MWFCIVTSGIFGLGNYLAPQSFTALLKVQSSDFIAISCVGGFLLAAVVGAGFSLKSGSWKEVRIATYYLATWSLLNSLRLALQIIINKDFGLTPNCVCTLAIGVGLAIVICQRLCSCKKKTA